MLFDFVRRGLEEDNSGLDIRELGIPAAIGGESVEEAVGVANLTVRRGSSGYFDDMDVLLKIDGDEVDAIPADSEFEYNIVFGPHVFELRTAGRSTFFDVDIDGVDDFAFEFTVGSEGKIENVNSEEQF